MTEQNAPKLLLVLFIAAFAVLTYFWWSIAEHLMYLVVNVDAYSHGQLVPFISIWLIWNNRQDLEGTDLFTWLPGLLLLFGASFLWIISEVGEIKILGHFAYVTAIQALVLAVFGPNFFQRFLFPCLFLYLAIPMGDSLVPIMQDVTAQLSVLMLTITGIPYTLDGILITLPSGVYEVAAACAGVRFLFTSFVTGVLLSHLLYKGWPKRLLMVFVAIVIPIFANVIRVYGIFLISEATDQSFAREVDHIVYGWGFLSAVLLIVIAVAYKFADTEVSAHPGALWYSFGGRASKARVTILIALILFIPIASAQIAPQYPLEAIAVKTQTVPACDNCDIRLVPGPNPYDKAIFAAVDVELHANYRIAADQIAVSAGLVCPQRIDASLFHIGNIPQGRGWIEHDKKNTQERRVLGIPFGETTYTSGSRRKLVWVTYYIDGKWSASSRLTEASAAWERLYKRQSASAMLVISARAYAENDAAIKILEKLLSTFPADSFLWEEIKPSAEGIVACAE